MQVDVGVDLSRRLVRGCGAGLDIGGPVAATTKAATHAMEEDPVPERRPDHVTDDLVQAVGKASEAAEYLIRARGALYEFHQLMGHADLTLGDAADALAAAGEPDAADDLRAEVIGRNAIDGRWTFQIVEEYDDLYYTPVQARLLRLEQALMDGRRHVFESEMKAERRSRGQSGHEDRPPAAWSDDVETIDETTV